MLPALLALTSQVSYGGVNTKISYTYQSIQMMASTVLYEKPAGDYFIALRADGQVSGKCVLVQVSKNDGFVVGVAFAAGQAQLSSCNISFATNGKTQMLELVHRAESFILLNSHVFIDGASGVNVKAAAVQLKSSTIHTSEISYNDTTYVPAGSFIAVGPPCTKCKAGELSKNCFVCGFELQEIDGKCQCLFPDITDEHGDCQPLIKANNFIDAGNGFGYIMSCRNNVIIAFDVISTNSPQYISAFDNDSCGLTNIIAKGQITHNVNFNTEMGALAFRVYKNISKITTFLSITKYGEPTFRLGGIATTIDEVGSYEISQIILSGKIMDMTRSVTNMYYGSYGGLLSYVAGYWSKEIHINLNNVLVAGQTMALSGAKNVGLIFGLVNCQFVQISNIIITSNTTPYYMQGIDISSVDFSAINFPCKDLASDKMKDSLKLQHLSSSQHSESNRAQITGSISNAGGIVGLYAAEKVNSSMTISMVMVDCDVLGYSIESSYNNWNNGLIAGSINQTLNFTLASAYSRGTFKLHCHGGGIAYIIDSTADVSFACNLTAQAQYSTGAVGCSGNSVVKQESAVVLYTDWYANEVGAIQGTVETGSNITVVTSFGKWIRSGGGSALGNIVGMLRGGASMNGVTEGTTLDSLDGCNINNC